MMETFFVFRVFLTIFVSVLRNFQRAAKFPESGGRRPLSGSGADAGFADAALIPEIPYTYEGLLAHLKRGQAAGKKHALVVVAEGLKTPDGKHHFAGNGRTYGGISGYFEERLREDGFNVRANILGHVQRAGTPVASDRLLASAFAVRDDGQVSPITHPDTIRTKK